MRWHDPIAATRLRTTLGIALPGFRKLDDLSSDGVTGGSTPSVCRSATRAISKATPMTRVASEFEPKAVTLVKEAFENSHGC